MTKKKRLINALIFLVGLIIFIFYYFEDDTNTDVVEEIQDVSAVSSADSMLNILNDEDFDFEEDSISSDSL